MPQVAESSLAIKADFPILARRFGERELIYLDSAATSQKPQAVIDAVAEHLSNHNANIHRGVYALAQEADAAYDAARVRVASFTGADRSENGRLTTIFKENPEQPFTKVTAKLKEGALAPVANPLACGVATTLANLVPYSPESPTRTRLIDSCSASTCWAEVKRRQKSPAVVGSGMRLVPRASRYASSFLSNSRSSKHVPPHSVLYARFSTWSLSW